MKKNVLRELLNEGKPTLSTRMVTTSPQIAEIIGHSGAFDFIELLGEYASWTVPDLENFARAVELFPNMTSMMKVEREPRMFTAQRSLGAGIQNVLFADCETAEEVQACVSYVRAPTPGSGGLHGASQRRNVGYIIENGSPEWVKAMDEVVIDIMIESGKAVDNLEAILDVKGVDMVHFGPSDYSLSVGKIGKSGSSEVHEVALYVIKTALNKGVRPRVVIRNYEEALEYWELGVRDFCVGNDLSILYRWCQLNGGKMRELFKDK